MFGRELVCVLGRSKENYRGIAGGLQPGSTAQFFERLGAGSFCGDESRNAADIGGGGVKSTMLTVFTKRKKEAKKEKSGGDSTLEWSKQRGQVGELYVFWIFYSEIE